MPQGKEILSPDFKAFSYSVEIEIDIIAEFGAKLSIPDGIIP
jgi:hypothetical protein